MEVEGPCRQNGKLGGRGGFCGARSPCSRSWRCCTLPSSWAGAHSPLWVRRLSAGTETVPEPRTLQIVGQAWGWGQGFVEQRRPSAGVEGAQCSFPSCSDMPPAWHLLTSLKGCPPTFKIVDLKRHEYSKLKSEASGFIRKEKGDECLPLLYNRFYLFLATFLPYFIIELCHG